MKKIIYFLVGAIVLFNLYLSSHFVRNNTIEYHTDIARDLLLLQEIVDTHKLSLIGPRSGGIDGLFHGPLWPWINLPAFIIGNGDPVVIGWFWIILSILSLGITFIVAKKIFNTTTALLCTIVLSSLWIQYAGGLYNPFGAVVISPLFFYFFYKYIQTLKVKYLLLTFFIIGLLIQFQVAFGGPMLLLTLFYLIPFLVRKKKIKHFLAGFILLLPLATYILFDIRHDFLQLRAILTNSGGGVSFLGLLPNRIDLAIKSLLITPFAPMWFYGVIWVVFFYILFKSYIDKKLKQRQFYFLFAYLYLGYWPLSFFLNGNVQGYHVIPFMAPSIIFFISGYRLMRKEVFALFISGVLFFDYTQAKTKLIPPKGWLTDYMITQQIVTKAPQEFGYYIFSTDEFGYSPRYAMIYTQKHYDKRGVLNNKKRKTFVILSPGLSTTDKNREWWVKNKVRINKPADKTIDYPTGYKVLEYTLTDEEIKIPSDPNLITDLSFR